MQYLWLENLVKEGSVRQDVCSEIYSDCGKILEKSANAKPGELMAFLDKAVPTVLTMGGIYGASVIKKRIEDSGTARAVVANRAKLLVAPEAAAYKEKAAARFDELSQMFPYVATNYPLASKLVLSRIHSGFTSEDLRALASTNLAKEDRIGSISGKVNAMSKTSEVRPIVLAKILADSLSIIKEASAAEDALKAGKNLLGTLAVVTGASAILGVGAGALHMVKSKLSQEKLKKDLMASFSQAVRQSDPHDEPLYNNKDKARQAFETLAHFSPNTAVNPSAARWFMNHMVSQDLGTSIGSVKELSEIERNIKGSKGPSAFAEGFKSMTDLTGISKTVSQINTGAGKALTERVSRDLEQLVH